MFVITKINTIYIYMLTHITLLIIQNCHSSSILDLGFILSKVCARHFDQILKMLQHCTNVTYTLEVKQKYIHTWGSRCYKQSSNCVIEKYSLFFLIKSVKFSSTYHWFFMWMSMTCNDDTQLLKQCIDQSCCSNVYNIVLSMDTFNEQTWLLAILNRGPLFLSLSLSLSLFPYFFYVIAMLIDLVAFGLKSEYEVHTQP